MSLSHSWPDDKTYQTEIDQNPNPNATSKTKYLEVPTNVLVIQTSEPRPLQGPLSVNNTRHIKLLKLLIETHLEAKMFAVLNAEHH